MLGSRLRKQGNPCFRCASQLSKIPVGQRFYSRPPSIPEDNNSNGEKHQNSLGTNDTHNAEEIAAIKKLMALYPLKKSPSPYEVLNISKSDNLSPKQIKKTFFQFAKIYHPDSINNLIEPEKKHDRFKIVLAAYNLLKNPISKANYDKYNIGWMDNTNLRTNPNMYNPSSPEYWNSNSSMYRNSSNFKGYESGTWEDRYRYGYDRAYGFQKDNTWTPSPTGSFKEEFQKNKKTIGLSVLFTISVYTALQFAHLYLYDDLIGENYTENFTVNVHEKSEGDLFHAYTNYGLGDTKEDRINRFLWWRKLSMNFSLADIREVLDHFYKRGVIEESNTTKLKQYERSDVR